MGEGGIVGRHHELSAADDFFMHADRSWAALVFEGDAGIGKTTIWQAAIERARSRGFRVLSCHPGQMETKLTLSALSDLLDEVPAATLDALPDPQRRALEVALLRTDPGTAGLRPREVSTAFHSVLRRLADERPLLVALDDTQWLDTASAAVLGFAFRRVRGPVGCLLTRRTGEASPDVDRLVPADNLARITVGPLSVGALHHVLKDRLRHPLTRPLLIRIHQACAGNPLNALEMARAVERRSNRPWHEAISVPENVRGLIVDRVRRLPRETQDALLACAAVPDPTMSLVDEAALQPAEDAEIVSVDDAGRISFRHPLYSSAVYGSAARARRRAVHARLAARAGDDEQRGRHLALAAAEPDEQVASALERGATFARLRGGWESAAESLEHAARLTPPNRRDEARRRTIAAADHHVHAGDRPRARTLLEGVLAEPLPPSLRSHALFLLGELASHDEHYLRAGPLFTEALEFADDPQAAAAAEFGLTFVSTRVTEFATAAEHAHRALEYADATGQDSAISEALALCAMTDFLCGKGVNWSDVDRSLALEDPDTMVSLQRRPSDIIALLMLYVGRHAEARVRLADVCRETRERGDESDLAFTLLWWSWLETRCGDYAAAERLAEEGATVAALTGSRSNHAWIHAQQAYIHAHRGEIERTRATCADAAGGIERYGNRLPALWIAASLALLELSLGNPDAAWRACEPLVSALEQRGIGEPVPAFFLPDALEALIALGRLDRADALLSTVEERARALDRPWALATAGRCRGLLLAARGDTAGALAALDAALAEHQRIELPFDRARTLLAKGVVERRARQRARARTSLGLALDEFDRLGTPLFAKRASHELRRTGQHRPTGQLTEGERRVAELAAAGRTNRAIAATLFISAKTVEANLARVYRKLGIGSRAELGAWLARSPDRGERPDSRPSLPVQR